MTSAHEADGPPRDSQVVVVSTKSQEGLRRTRLKAYDPERLVRRALVAYRDPGSKGSTRVFVEAHKLSVLHASFWNKCLWNYFPHTRTHDGFNAFWEKIQRRADVITPAHALHFEKDIIRDCLSGKFQREEKARERTAEMIAPFCADLEGRIRRTVLKAKSLEARQEAQERLWSFCAEPDGETALLGLFGQEEILDLAQHFETYIPPHHKRPPLHYWLVDGTLSPEARLLASELRFAFLSNTTRKGERFFEGHPAFPVSAHDLVHRGDEDGKEEDDAQEAA